MGYSRYFGMRSFENIVRDGRFRVPKTGTPFKIGAPVVLDGATPGFLKAAGDGAPAGPAAGVVVFEHIQLKGVDTSLVGPHDAPFDQVPLGQYAQMVHGAGTKVWFKNVGDKTLYDGRVQTGGTLLAASVDLATLTPGTGLVPDGAGKFRVAAAADLSATPPVLAETPWLVVEQVNPTTGLVEARLTF